MCNTHCDRVLHIQETKYRTCSDDAANSIGSTYYLCLFLYDLQVLIKISKGQSLVEQYDFTSLAPPKVLRQISSFQFQRIDASCEDSKMSECIGMSFAQHPRRTSAHESPDAPEAEARRPETPSTVQADRDGETSDASPRSASSSVSEGGGAMCLVCMECSADAVLLECGHRC